MDFIIFAADTCNIWPAANTTNGGQLVTEWSMRSREMVATDPSVTYEIGPSFVHGEADFEVSILTDNGGSITSTSMLAIAPGRGVINGHYFESLVQVSIDIAATNNDLASKSMPILKGRLAVGMKACYATEATVAGTIKVEDKDDMLLGVQLVILPYDEIKTPSDCPNNKNEVNADLVLAEFTYTNNAISDVTNLSTKLQYLTSDRVKDLETIVSNKYVTKTGLNSKKIYAFAGKGQDPQTGYDTWEDVTDSLVVWDDRPVRTSVKPEVKQAGFIETKDNDGAPDGIYLVVPHKQVYGMTADDGSDQYYAPRVIEVPRADYSTSTSGVVTPEYTRHIQDLSAKVNEFRSTLQGKQLMYMEIRTATTELPTINQDSESWEIGNYILVGHDDHLTGSADATQSSPATMYFILPGKVESVRFIETVDGSEEREAPVPSDILGVELDSQEWYETAGQEEPGTEYVTSYPQLYDPQNPPRGIPYNYYDDWRDYFRIRYYRKPPEGSQLHPFTDYYYGVYTSGPKEWSDAVMLTGSIPLASESIIGGFYNASSKATDNGYVRLDDTGHLKLIDYEILRSGTLAYQLSDDITLPTGISIDEIQNYIYEYVNQRVAFPSTNTDSDYPNVIHLTITFPNSEDGGEIDIEGIDSRFNTAVCLHILGEANSKTVINIRDCQKIMIDSNIQGTPIINMYRCNLRYDSEIIQYIRTCTRSSQDYGEYKGFRDMSLWYEKMSEYDPNLTVNDMTVSELDSHILIADINYWKELNNAVVNDNDYLVAIKSITFSSDFEIIGCEILAANNSTDNIVIGDKIVVGQAELPQGSSLIYPTASVTHPLKVTGTFTSAYKSNDNIWYVTDTSFTLLTGVYSEVDTSNSVKGQVAFHSKSAIIPVTVDSDSIAAWEPDSYHIFQGGVIN